MTSARPTITSDATQQRLVRMQAAYTEKINSALQAGQDGLARELAERTFAEELSGLQSGGRTSA